MKKLKRILAMFMALLVLVSTINTDVFAAESMEATEQTTEKETSLYYNPLYSKDNDLENPRPEISVPDVQIINSKLRSSTDLSKYAKTVKDAAKQLRAHMKQRQSDADVYVQIANPDELSDYFYAIFYEAMAHTGVGTEGDSLAWVWESVSSQIEALTDGSVYYFTITYKISYYTNLQQENTLTAAIESLKKELALDGKSDYEIVKAIYDYMTSHISYDYDNLDDDSYKLKYTAYAALINKTSVCQGYALLFYRLALEHGVDARLISGYSPGGGHAWNIVKVGKYYYNLDSTWDAGRYRYRYFLLCDANFIDHTRDDEYLQSDFTSKYVMDDEDHVFANNGDGVCEQHVYETILTKATLNQNGSKINACTICGYEASTSYVIYAPKKLTLSTSSYKYDGNVKQPSVTVIDAVGNTLTKGTDYKVAYESGRKNPGTYTVRITFLGNYTGTKDLYFTIAPSAPTGLTTTANTASAITLKWNAVSNADGYKVFKYNSSTKEFEAIKGLTGTSYTVTDLKPGTKYYFKVRAFKKDGSNIWGDYSSSFTTATAPVAPSISGATQTTTSITLKWNAVTGADGYRIYQYNSSTKAFEGLVNVTGTSYTVKDLKAGTNYYFKVRAYKKADKTILGSYSSSYATATKPASPSITKISSTKGKASFTWSNVAGETGFQVYYSTSKDGTYTRVDNFGANVLTGSKSSLTSGKTYYFKVRAYKSTDNGVIYGAFSTPKSITIK